MFKELLESISKVQERVAIGGLKEQEVIQTSEDTHPMTRRHMPLDPNPGHNKLRHTTPISC
jgi:hypothetical protein